MNDIYPLPSPLSHAYIITGGSAAGRLAYAKRLAQAYVCQESAPPCGRCRHCEKAAAGIHPDVISVTPAEGRRDILAEQARALRSDAYIRPNEAQRKVYLIDPAESMNATAQNTLLKVLEEGPPYAAFLLLTGQAGGLLQTIRSRCETLTLPPEEDLPQPDRAQAREGAEELLRRLCGGDELALAEFCVGLEKWDRDSLSALMEETVSLLRDVLAVQTGGPVRLDCPPAVRQAAERLPARRLLAAADVCGKLRAACGFNTGAGHVAGWLCAALAGAAL